MVGSQGMTPVARLTSVSESGWAFVVDVFLQQQRVSPLSCFCGFGFCFSKPISDREGLLYTTVQSLVKCQAWSAGP